MRLQFPNKSMSENRGRADMLCLLIHGRFVPEAEVALLLHGRRSKSRQVRHYPTVVDVVE